MNSSDFSEFFNQYKNIIIPASFVVVFILIVIIGNYFRTKQKIIRILSKLPKENSGSLRTNIFSKISGKVKAINTPLIAPYSKRKCVFYSIKIEQRKKSGKQRRWKTLVKEEEIQDFLVETSGDYVIVKPNKTPKNYLSYLVIDSKVSSGTFNNPSTKFDNLLSNYNIKSTNLFGLNKQLRYTEGIIEIGETITVAGTVKRTSLNQPLEGYSYSKIVELSSTDQQKIIITDLPNIKSKRRV